VNNFSKGVDGVQCKMFGKNHGCYISNVAQRSSNRRDKLNNIFDVKQNSIESLIGMAIGRGRHDRYGFHCPIFIPFS